ncbi:PKD domain-containing protein [Singulisphaera sp. GP187]|uniref:PKD domain-containing protein n=1 Tax=Singulisphaera sp. GP187 TaxID=1882752 RepID=UPI0009270BFB|nr:PKD domain-containing protein [Singulisphaera sp. GP187]SIO22824.1 PKD domain-containing protein [Singulisphaera sp. GP187]
MKPADSSICSRFCLVLGVWIVLGAGPLRAEDIGTVLKSDEQPRTMLYRALERQAHELLEARRKTVAGLQTPEAVRQRQTEIRAKFLEALGDLPEKTPLNARVVATDPRDGYRVERLVYESRPGHHVTGVLYLPTTDSPVPGVLVPCGHSQNGKAGDTYQRICISLAKNGMAALCYDPIGQGERLQLLDDQGKAAILGSTTEHTMAGIGSLLVGRSLASYRIWDGIRSLDYLASRPEVDPKRLGCTGNSGGGTLTAYLMALDDRIAVAAPSCYLTSLDRLFSTIGPQDAEQNITGQVAFGMDHGDYAILRAPKPTLFSVGTRDFFDIQGSWDTFREVKLVYGRLGFGERVDLFESDEPHGFTKPRREAATRWLRRWLLKIDDAPVESDFAIATDAQLQCTETGQVLSSFHGKSVFDLNIEHADELARRREQSQAKQDKATRLAQVRRRIGLRDSITPADREERGEALKRSGYTIRKLVFTTEPGIKVPALLLIPEKTGEGKRLTVVVGDDKRESLALGHQSEPLAKSGNPVLIVGLRGMGETAPSTKSGPFGVDSKEAFLAINLGRPLLGQRVGDLLSVIGAVAAEYQDGIALIGQGTAGPIALHATALEPRINALSLDSAITSWSDIVRTPITRDQLSNTVPGALVDYDLPDLAALVAPRPLTIAASVDPAGRPLSPEQVAAAYRLSTKAYQAQDANAKLSLKPGPPRPTTEPLVRVVDLSVGESAVVTLADGKEATVKLIDLKEDRDPIRQAVRGAQVKVEVNGKPVTLATGNYNLPVPAGGVQVDCPITGGCRGNSGEDSWALEKDARIRLWPAKSPWIDPTAFSYPVRQRWFATSTQMANEPVYVDGGEKPDVKKIYYHSGLDIGGAEGLVDVVAATDGFVASAGTTLTPGFQDTPARPRYDVVYLVDPQGWYYRYSHLQSIDPAITPGASVRKGQKIGVLGKEGASGGWSHLHFEIKSQQPSGRWGTEEGYAYLWQAAQREQKPDLVAVARPHRLSWTGEPVTLDGTKSWSRSGSLARYEWTLSDGTSINGPKVEHVYDRPGAYTEILKVTDRQGHVDYDFAIVQVLDRSNPDQLPPTIHASFMPTTGIKPGEPVTFKVRTFRTTDGEETWDFGDGTPAVTSHSDGTVKPLAKDGYAILTHPFAKPGHYLVRVERANRQGAKAVARLHVVVDEPNAK